MGYKQFVADLRAAKEADIDAGVTEIRPGESEGSVSFNYTHQKLVSPLEIHVLDQSNTSSLVLSTIHPRTHIN
jgi:hypothetical protein